jgi:cullin-associated NEDD8-dissociated protein 1
VLEAVVAKKEQTAKESKRTVAVIEAETKPRVVSEVTITGLSAKEFQAVDLTTGLSKEDEFRIQIAKDLGVEDKDVIISKISVTETSRRRLSAASIEVAFIVVRKAAEKVAALLKKVAALKLAVKGASVSKASVPKAEAAKAKAAVEAALKAAEAAAAKAEAALAVASKKYEMAKKEAAVLSSGVSKVLSPGVLYLAHSGKHELIRITKTLVAPTKRTTLGGRSYGGHGWEAASNSRATELRFSCGLSVKATTAVHATSGKYTVGDKVCSVLIPDIDDGRYHIEVFDYSSETVDAGSLASRFLATATFGANQDEISAFQSTYGGKREAWITAQMGKPATLHREFFRARSNKPFPTTLLGGEHGETDLVKFSTANQDHIYAAASPLLACTPGSRWTKFAFTKADIDYVFEAKPISETTYADSEVFTNVGHTGNCCGKYRGAEELGRSARETGGTNSYAYGTVTSVEGCKAECKAKSDCKYFTYHPTRKQCVYCSTCNRKMYTKGPNGYSFTSETVQFTSWKKSLPLEAVPQRKLSLTVEDHLRTTFFDDAGYLQNIPKPYRICSVEEKVGGSVTFGADCSGYFPNPALALESFPKDSVVVKTKHFIDTSSTVSNGIHLPGVKILGEGASTFSCATAPMHGPQFGVSDTDGSVYMFDRRVRLAGNTLEAPDSERPTTMRYVCPNVPKTFLNAHTCRTGVESCAPVSYKSKLFTLNETIIKQFYTLAKRHVHVITGLTLEKGASPCTSGSSRWVSRKTKCDDRLDSDSRAVIVKAVQAGSREKIADRSNDVVRDVTIHKQCKAEAGAQVMVDGVCWEHVHKNELNVYDFTFWADAHEDKDASEALKEGSKTVAAFAETGSAEFKWTGSMPLWAATVKDRRMRIGLLGTLDNNVDFLALPLTAQVEQIARLVGSEKKSGDAATEVCGSPGEVANNPTLGDTIELHLGTGASLKHQHFDTDVAQHEINAMVWSNVNLNAQDQLRQRMAWALSQVFIVDDSTGLYRKKPGNEHSFAYYDIFVRNAFGNYKDILKEVAYSPMMGSYLTYTGSASKKVTGNAPDENFAREVMQLFSMGLYKLNEDGTRVTDDKGDFVLSYDIEDVASLSAGWTGFNRRHPRGNLESAVLMARNGGARGIRTGGAGYLNFVDPMTIVGMHRDTNPKRTPTRGYIGDGFPLCVDLPKHAFLKSGAHYRYLGSTPHYDKLKGTGSRDYGEYGEDSQAHVELKTDSALYKQLCGATSESCNFKSVLTLSENLSCSSSECDLDQVRIVKLANAGTKENGDRYHVYYEYVRQACVQQSFFANPKVATSNQGLYNTPGHFAYQHHKSMVGGRFYRPMCVNPETMAAESACCPKTSDGCDSRKHGRRSCGFRQRMWAAGKDDKMSWRVKYIDTKEVATCDFKFTNERVTYATAEARCEARGEELCDFEGLVAPKGCATNFAQFWRPGKCSVFTQIAPDGHVNIVDDIPNMQKTNTPDQALDSTDRFRVVWADDKFPTAETGCGACTVRGKTCVCSSEVSNTAALTALPSSRNEAISALTVGALDPTTLDAGTYVVGAKNSEATVYFLKSKPGFTVDAIVMVHDESKKSKPLFFKNLVSTVYMGEKSTGFSFRNPVSFHSKYERTTRDAEHETDAILDYYFQHSNTPPFFANNMIQRFVTSNPSPRYVKAVATAFKTGSYGTFGSGTRGDLAATMAAVLLDEEAQSPLVQKDPTYGRVREPVVKFLHLMRAFDFKQNKENPQSKSLVNFHLDALGQEPYEAPSVFSWFDYDYAPTGVVDKASLVAPESKLSTSHNLVKFFNGAQSLIRWGLTNCDGGLSTQSSGMACHNFGVYQNGAGWRKRDKGWLPSKNYIEEKSTGILTYSPTDPSASAADIVKELDQVLTGGRLDPHQRKVIEEAYSSKLKETSSVALALKTAQQLLVVTPEFHTSAPNPLTTEERKSDPVKVSKAKPEPYKAIVYMWLGGGADSYNLLVPYDGCKGTDLYKVSV